MQDHPFLAHKYLIPEYTRGDGVDVCGQPLYQHFKQPFAGMKNLDFVLSNQDPGMDEVHAEALRVGGHLLTIEAGKLRIRRKAETGLVETDSTIPGKSVCICRFGGFGDMLQASNLFPEFKRQGYQVYVMTTPKGQDVIAHDPHVDGWVIQDTDQVPNPELFAYWEVQAARFTKFVNLSESVEGTLLAFEGRANHSWPDALRRREMNRNYLEWTAELAEVPYRSEARFYPMPEETQWARDFLAQLRVKALGHEPRPLEHVPERFTLMWCLSGSSVHKMYPHQDTVLATLMATYPELSVVLVGDPLCELLEQGWEDHPRVACTSGKLSIRQTLALAQEVDCVAGPETGVLNAVAFEDVGKVLLLSHSTRENLSKHWPYTVTVAPKKTACYPCHRLHYTRKYCPEHEPTGASMCAFNTDPQEVAEGIAGFVEVWRNVRALRRAA